MRMRALYENLEGGIVANIKPSTLNIYVFSNTDPEYERNLQFFIKHGMWEGDGCNYVIIVQQVSCAAADRHPAGLRCTRKLTDACFSVSFSK